MNRAARDRAREHAPRLFCIWSREPVTPAWRRTPSRTVLCVGAQPWRRQHPAHKARHGLRCPMQVRVRCGSWRGAAQCMPDPWRRLGVPSETKVAPEGPHGPFPMLIGDSGGACYPSVRAAELDWVVRAGSRPNQGSSRERRCAYTRRPMQTHESQRWTRIRLGSHCSLPRPSWQDAMNSSEGTSSDSQAIARRDCTMR